MVYKSLRKLAPRMLTRAQHWLLPTQCIACGCAGGLQLVVLMRLPRLICVQPVTGNYPSTGTAVYAVACH